MIHPIRISSTGKTNTEAWDWAKKSKVAFVIAEFQINMIQLRFLDLIQFCQLKGER